MMRTVMTLAAFVALTTSPALAGEFEPPDDLTRPVWLAIPQPEPKGYGALVTSETDGDTSPAAMESVRLVRYPDEARPPFDRDK